MLAQNLLLALAWMLINNSFTLADVIVGVLFGFLVLRVSWNGITDERFSMRRYFRFTSARPFHLTWRWVRFIAFGFKEIVKSNIAVAKIVLSPRMNLRPGIVAIPLDLKSDEGITTLANLITLTPGTVTLDVSSDRRTLYIHALEVGDAAALRDDTKNLFERRVKELLP